MAVRLRTTNLIVNPGAELGPSAGDYSSTVAPQGWITSSNFSAVDYGIGSATQLNAADTLQIAGGSSFFAGGPGNANSSATQHIDISAFAAQIDMGGVSAFGTAFFGGFAADDDNMVFTITQRNQTGGILQTTTAGGILAADRGNSSLMQLRLADVSILSGARSIDVTLTSVNPSGGYNDGYADNLSLTLLDMNGGFGDLVEVNSSIDFRLETIQPATGIMFAEQASADFTATFATEHFGAGKLTLAAQIVASARSDTLVVALAPGDSFSAAAFKFDDGRWADGVDVVRLLGSNGGESATGSMKSDILDGAAGDDLLQGGPGDDTLIGGLGADTLVGGGGADVGDYAANAQAVVVFLHGATNATVTVNGAVEDTVREIENLNGGSANDVLVGDATPNLFNGNGGQDFLFSNGFNVDGTMKAGAGDDTLNGDAGNDGLFAGDGADALFGGPGDDGLVGGSGNDQLNGNQGVDFLFGGSFSVVDGSFLPGSGKDTLFGNDGNDGLYGFDGDDIIFGGNQDDYIEAGSGNDESTGGAGNDFVLGQDGEDMVTGGVGFDYEYGGTGADTFVYRPGDSADWILDFDAAQGDKLRLLGFAFAGFTSIPLVDLSTPGHPAVQLTVTSFGSTDQLTIFGVTLAQLNASNVIVV